MIALSLLLALAQGQAADAWVAEGRISRATDAGAPQAVSGLWVVLHRVGTDASGPLDSMRTDRAGRYRIRYSRSGDPNALYFVSARYGGIAYFSSPLRVRNPTGGDGDVIVYETTNDTALLRVQGRHLVISAPRGQVREVAEIFEIDNSGSRTVVARDSATPIWAVRLPERAESASVAPGDLSAASTFIRNGRAEVFAPISPGLRQLVLTYRLPPDAFPLTRPLDRPVGVLEVLLEEPRAVVDGAKLSEVSPASIDQRVFRRFLAQDVPGVAAMRVTAPPPVEQNRNTVRIVVFGTAAALVLGVGFWASRVRGGAAVSHGPFSSEADVAIAELATLDARFDDKAASAKDRAEYQRRRGELKERVARLLAVEKTAT